jgi:ribosomal-protein-alanine N-acetyltransferase
MGRESYSSAMVAKAAELHTARLVLRRARVDDLDAIHQIMADEQIMRYWSTLPHASREETELWLAGMLSEAAGESDEFVLEHDGEVIGKLGAWRLPEIGFYLRRDRWGQGFASEALDGFITYIASRGFTYLTADVDPLNTASLNLLKGAGFQETGREAATYIVGDRTCDSVYLRLDLQPA